MPDLDGRDILFTDIQDAFSEPCLDLGVNGDFTFREPGLRVARFADIGALSDRPREVIFFLADNKFRKRRIFGAK